MVHPTSSGSSFSSQAASTQLGLQPASDSTYADLWIQCVNSDIELIAFLVPFSGFQEREERDPTTLGNRFFPLWGQVITQLFQGPDKRSAAEILELIWCLFNRFPEIAMQERFLRLIQESSGNLPKIIDHLGLILTCSKNRFLLEPHLEFLKEPSRSNQSCLEFLMRDYLRLFKNRLHGLVDSIPRCDASMKELATCTELGRMLASSLIDDRGRLIRGAASFWLHFFPTEFPHLPEIYKKQLSTILQALNKDPELANLLNSIRSPCKKLEIDLRIQLQLPLSAPLNEVHSREAALSALLAFLRQGVGHDCYLLTSITSVLLYDPKIIVRNLKRMIEEGTAHMPGDCERQKKGLRLDITFHSKYASIPMTRQEMTLSRPIQLAMEDLGLPTTAGGVDSGELLPPFLSLCLQIAQTTPEENWQLITEKQRHGQNRISSFFQNHLLSRFCHQARFFSINLTENTIGLKRDLFDRFCDFAFFPDELAAEREVLKTLSPLLRIRLETNLFLDREDNFLQLIYISSRTQFKLEDLMNGIWGPFQYIDSTQQKTISIGTWKELNAVLWRMTKECLEEVQLLIPQIDSAQASALEIWKNRTVELESGFRNVAKESAKRFGINYPENLSDKPFSLFYSGGGNPSVVLNTFFGLNSKEISLSAPSSLPKKLHPMQELVRLVQTLHSEIPPDPTPNSLPIAICTFYTKSLHSFNLLPYNDSLHRIWKQPLGFNQLDAELSQRGIYKSKLPFSLEQKNVLTRRILNVLVNEEERVAFLISLIPPCTTLDSIEKHWAQNPLLAPHLSELKSVLTLFEKIVLTAEQKAHLVSLFTKQVVVDSGVFDELCAVLTSPDLTMETLFATWNNNPTLAPHFQTLRNIWSHCPLSAQQRDALIQALPQNLRLEASLRILDPTAETIRAQWAKSPSLSKILNHLQIELNFAVEMVSWKDWEKLILKIAQLFPFDQNPAKREALSTHLLQVFKKRKGEQLEPQEEGLNLDQGVRFLHEELVKINSSLEYNQTLGFATTFLRFPNKILLGDLNYSPKMELWFGFQYGCDQLIYYMTDANSAVRPSSDQASLLDLTLATKSPTLIDSRQRI